VAESVVEKWPLVSVVVPAYNSERHIEGCLRSIVEQDYPSLEVIVVDDGSTDQTGSLVGAFGGPVHYVRQQNSGSAVARNVGVQLAQGEYIGFNDSDDLWAPHRLKQQVTFLRSQSEYLAVCGRFMAVAEDFTRADAARQEYQSEAVLDREQSGWTYLRLLETSIYHIDTLLVDKGVMGSIRFNPDYRRGQDFDFWLQLVHATPIAQLDNLYAFYRQNPGGISRRPHARNYRAEIIAAALGKYGRTDQLGREVSQRRVNQILAMSWYSHGYELYRARWFRKAAGSFWKAIKLDPSPLGAYKHLLMSGLSRWRDETPADGGGR
jgi:glycosyltransferase involved in cell wall biosynthesis